MTITEQLSEDLKDHLTEHRPADLAGIPVHERVEAGKRPIPCIVIHVDETAELMEPLNTTYEVDGHIDILTSLDKHPLSDARRYATEIHNYLNMLDGLAVGQSFLHSMEARPVGSETDERAALHRVHFEAIVQPCEE